MKYALHVATFLLVNACGTAPAAKPSDAALAADPSPSKSAAAPTDAVPLSLSVATLADVPTCTKERQGELVSVVADKTFHTCDNGSWTQIDVKGKDGISQALDVTDEPVGTNCAEGGEKIQTYIDANGNGLWDIGEKKIGKPKYICHGATGTAGVDGAKGAAGIAGAVGAAGATGAAGAVGATGATGIAGATGATGAAGAVGAAGTNGNDNHIVKMFVCSGATLNSHFTPSTLPIHTTYTAWITSYGDVRAQAQIIWDSYLLPGPQTISAGWSAVSDTSWAKTDAGSDTASTHQTFNMVGGPLQDGIWTWTLNRTAATLTVTMADLDLGGTGVATWTHSCTVTNY